MSAESVLRDTIRPVLDWLWAEHRVPNGPRAVAMMVAIGLQESRFVHRDQVVPGKPAGSVGPATGFWQFEKGGGVAGVMQHALTADIARKVAAAAGVDFERDTIWRALTKPEGDQLAAGFARLLLYTDPRPLPDAAAEAEEEAWDYYQRNWRPGRPHRGTWGGFWRQAVGMAAGEPQPAARPAEPAGPAQLEARVARLERIVAAIGAAARG